MGKLVDVEGIGRVEFPDDYTPEQIQAVWQRDFRPIIEQKEYEQIAREKIASYRGPSPDESYSELKGVEAGFRGAGEALLSAAGTVGRSGVKALASPLRAAGTIADVIRSKVGDFGSVPTTPGDRRSALTQGAEFIERKAEEFTPAVKPEFEEQFVAGDVASGLGNVAAMLAGGGVAAGVAKAAGKAALPAAVAGTATLGFTSEFDDAFKRATTRGDSPDLALAKALGYGTVAAMIESGLGAGRLLKKIMPDPKTAVATLGKAGVAKEALKNVVAGYGEEALQRASQDLIVDGKLDLPAINREGLAGAVVQGLIGLPTIRQGSPTAQPSPQPPATAPAATPPASTPAAGVVAPVTGAALSVPPTVQAPRPKVPAPQAPAPQLPATITPAQRSELEDLRGDLEAAQLANDAERAGYLEEILRAREREFVTGEKPEAQGRPRPEAVMEARTVPALGLQRERVRPPADPDLAAAVEDIRRGYAPQIEERLVEERPVNITVELFKELDKFVSKGDQIGVHTMKRLIEGRPRDEVEAALDIRLSEREQPSPQTITGSNVQPPAVMPVQPQAQAQAGGETLASLQSRRDVIEAQRKAEDVKPRKRGVRSAMAIKLQKQVDELDTKISEAKASVPPEAQQADAGERELTAEISRIKSATGPLTSSERIDLNELRLSAQNKKLSRLSQAYLENLEGRATQAGEGALQRDKSKPEQMTPEEYAAGDTLSGTQQNDEAFVAELLKRGKRRPDGSVTVTWNQMVKAKEKTFAMGIEKMDNAAGVVTALIPGKQYLLQPRDGYSRSFHRASIAASIRSNLPVSASAVDTYGIKLPPGYVREGELYVYRPEGGLSTNLPTAGTSNENYRWQTDPQGVARDLAGRRDVLRGTQDEINQVFADAYESGLGQQPSTAGQPGRARVSAVSSRPGAQAFAQARVFLPTDTASPAARQNAEILARRFLQGAGREGQSVLQPVGKSDFVHTLGEKTGAKIVFRPLVGGAYAQLDRLPGVGDFISINTDRLGELDFSTQSASFDAILSEELLHLITMRLSSDAEVASVWKSLSPKERQSTLRAYGNKGLSDTQLGAEYIRLVLQQRLEGRVTEETATLSNKVRAILRKLLDYLYAEFGKKPKDALARAVVERIEAAVKGDAPIRGSVFGGAPLASGIGKPSSAAIRDTDTGEVWYGEPLHGLLHDKIPNRESRNLEAGFADASGNFITQAKTLETTGLASGEELFEMSPKERRQWFAMQRQQAELAPTPQERDARLAEIDRNEKLSKSWKSLGAPIPRTAQPSLSVKQTVEALFPFAFGGLPPNTEVTHRLDITHNGRQVRGWYDPSTQKIWLNAAYLKTPQEARAVFIEEAFHSIQNDPKVQKEMKRLLDSLTPEQLAAAEAAYGDAEVARFEAVADILEQESLSSEQRGIFSRLWTAVKDAVKRVFGMVNPDWVSVDTDARTIISHALRAVGESKMTNVSGKQFLSRSMSPSQLDKKDAEYLAAVRRGDVETAQRMVDEAASDAGYDPVPYLHHTFKEFTVFKPGGGKVPFGPESWSGNAIWLESEKAAKARPLEEDLPPIMHNVRLEAAKRGLKTKAEVRAAMKTMRLYAKPLFPIGGTDSQWRESLIPEYGFGKEFPRLVKDSDIETLRRIGRDSAYITDRRRNVSELVLLDPSQVKSADPIVRDDAGNIIPLSQRFQQESPDIRYSIGDPIGVEALTVQAAAEQVAAQGEQLYSELEAGARSLENSANQTKPFREARSELNRLAKTAEERLRQLPDAPPDAQPSPTEGVGVVGGQVVADDTFSDKLSALRVAHDPQKVKAAQEAIFFEELAKNTLAARNRLADWQSRLAYYQQIKSPAQDIKRIETTIKSNQTRLAKMEAIEHNGTTAGQRADELASAESEALEARAKLEALQLDPVNNFFGERLAKLRGLLDKASAAASLLKAMAGSQTDTAEVERLTKEYEQFERLPEVAKVAMQEGVMTDEQRSAIVAALEKSLQEFDVARAQMNNLLSNEQATILNDIQKQEKVFNGASGEEVAAKTAIDAALRAVKSGETGLIDSVASAARVDNLLQRTEALSNMAMRLGENLEQNRWLYDYLSGWSDTAGLPVFTKANADALGVGEDVLRDAIKIASESPAFGSAIVAIADAAAAQRAASLPLQLQGVAQDPQQAASVIATARRKLNAAGGAQSGAAAKISQSLQRLMALSYGANLFNQTANNPALKAIRDQLSDRVFGPTVAMYASGPNSETYLAFGDEKKGTPHAPQIVVNVADDPSIKRQTQEKIWNWVKAAQEYVAGYESIRVLHNMNPNAPSPEDAGYKLPVVRGLKNAIPSVLATNFDPSMLNPGQRLKAPWFERKLLSNRLAGFIFRQHDRVARLMGGETGIKLRNALGDWVKGALNSRQVSERFQTLPELTEAALKSHSKPGSLNHLSIENYRQNVWNPMAHLGRQFSTTLKPGLQLPTGEVVTKEDIALLKKEIEYGEALRREVTEVGGKSGVRYEVDGVTYFRPGASVGDLGMSRHLSNRSKTFIAAIQNAYADGKGFDQSTDLSPGGDNAVVRFWNQRTDMLRDHIFDSTRDDRKLTLDPLMRRAETALKARWQASGVAQVDSLADLAQQLAAELPPTSGVSPLSYVIRNLNTELATYERNAREIEDTRKKEDARNTGLKIALSADNEFTKPAALLELPSSLYDYGALSPLERIAQQSRANHERLVDYANALRRAINELGVKISESQRPDADKSKWTADYGENLSEMRDVQRALQAVLDDFEIGLSARSPAMLPGGVGAELVKTPVGAVLALPVTNLRNLSLGQFQVYLANEAMGYMSSRMAALQALHNIPKALTRTAYTVANSIATRLDPKLSGNRKTLEKLVDAIAPIVLTPLQLSTFNPKLVQSDMERVRQLGFDTRGSLRETYRQIRASEEMFKRSEDLEFAQNYPRLEKARKGAAVGAESINATLAKIGVENTDQVLNSLNSAATDSLEGHLEDVAMEYGKRLEKEGITEFEAFNPKIALQPLEWTRAKSLQAAADSLATMRLVLESSAGGEGFQLEQALLKYYNDVKAGREASVFTGAQREAVERRLLAEMNTSLPTNRASASSASPVFRYLLTLNGYPADAMLKIIGVAFSGTRDRRTVATIGAKLPLLTKIALMAVIIGAAAGVATEWWKRYIQGVHTSRAGVLDEDFWTDPKKFASGVTGYMASNLSYLGDAINSLQNQVQGGRGFELSQKSFYPSFLQAVSDAIYGSVVTAKGAGTLSDIIQPFVDLSTRMTPGGLELRRAFGNDRTLNTARQVTAAEARAAGMEMPKAGASPTFGPTTIVRRRLASAVGAMSAAQQASDAQAYRAAEADAQEQIGKLENYYKEQWISRGDDEEKATKKAKQAVWNDYQEANPIVAALGGRRPTQAQVEMLTSGATGGRAEVQRNGLQAWQEGAQALFGRSAGTSKEEVKSMRSAGAPAPSIPTSTPSISPVRISRGRRLSLRPRRISSRVSSRPSAGSIRLRRLRRPRATQFKRLKLSV